MNSLRKLSLLFLFLWVPAAEAQEKPFAATFPSGEPLTHDDVRRLLDKSVTLEWTVKSIGVGFGNVFLNATAKSTEAENVTAVLLGDCLAEMEKMGIKDTKRHFLGKTIRVKGVLLYSGERPTIDVRRLAQIEEIKKK